MNLSDCKHIHFVGIGGIGVSALAEIAFSHGVKVTGSDMKVNEVTQLLEEVGIKVFIGHGGANVEGADLLVYSTAVSLENPELVYAREHNIPILTRSQALGAIMENYPVSIAVSGTHGKTTTTSMVSLILKNAQFDPTILVGGILNEFHSNVVVGKSKYFITEACEYMDSFLDLNPFVEIILNIDSDHLDYFKDIYHIEKSFNEFASHVPSTGFIVAYDANPFVKMATENLPCNVVTFGYNEGSDFYAKNINFNEMGCASFDVYSKGENLGRIQLSVPGEHNITNSLAATATCLRLCVEMKTINETLEEFHGTQRRFDILGKTSTGFMLVDDYAHHPTEIKATLAAAQKLDHKSVWCLFQPHTYTRTMALMDEFADAFVDADHVVLAEIYAAREKNISKLSSKELLKKIKEKHPTKDVCFFSDFESIADFAYNNAVEGDVVITMGAGDIFKVGKMIMEKDKK
ncbi:MAG: UDP-N-acetylmuramate--L-alanine ligase [Clostridia bacterium]|nr:UDP-N-acetylmuramate--L-alanine ligase [Clostridia bacterium]